MGALFGTGGQAAYQMIALLTVRRLKEIRVFDIDEVRIPRERDTRRGARERHRGLYPFDEGDQGRASATLTTRRRSSRGQRPDATDSRGALWSGANQRGTRRTHRRGKNG